MPYNTQLLASQPFTALDETGSDSVLRWDASSGYTSSTTAVEPGDGFWLINQESTNRDVFLAGEVVLSASNTALLQPGLNLVGYPYSSPVRLNETALGALTDRVEILKGDAATPDGSENILGKGYWVKSLSEECVVWTEVRPYENVFPENGLPDITAITATGGSNVVLSIACEGGELLDVFYQDIHSTNVIESARNWQLAAANVSANGQTQIEWGDSGSEDRAAPGEIAGRYYLVGRADIDLDGNGIPDARELFVSHIASPMSSLPAEGVLQGAFETDAATVGAGATPDSTNRTLTGQSNVVVSPPSFAIGRVIYVDKQAGRDTYSGRLPVPAVSESDGPKQTIRSGLAVAEAGDVLVIKKSCYGEDLNVVGRDVKVMFEGSVNLCGGETHNITVVTNQPSAGNVHTNW